MTAEKRDIREIAYSLMPRPVYRGVSFGITALRACQTLGPKRYIELLNWNRRASSDLTREFMFPRLRYPLECRPQDVPVAFGTLVRQEYATDLYPRADEVRVVIDAGANIGDMTSWYLSRFPAALVIGIEPDPENLAVLRRNTRHYGARAAAVHAALWHEDGELTLSKSQDPAAISVSNAGTATCPAVCMPTIIRDYGIDTIDVFKCDIEGAEARVFEHCDSWIDRVRMMIVETHSDESARTVTEKAIEHGFTPQRYGWLRVFVR